MNSRDVIEAGRAVGLEYPDPLPMRALLDTGASVTVISRVFANHCKLFRDQRGKYDYRNWLRTPLRGARRLCEFSGVTAPRV